MSKEGYPKRGEPTFPFGDLRSLPVPLTSEGAARRICCAPRRPSPAALVPTAPAHLQPPAGPLPRQSRQTEPAVSPALGCSAWTCVRQQGPAPAPPPDSAPKITSLKSANRVRPPSAAARCLRHLVRPAGTPGLGGPMGGARGAGPRGFGCPNPSECLFSNTYSPGQAVCSLYCHAQRLSARLCLLEGSGPKEGGKSFLREDPRAGGELESAASARTHRSLWFAEQKTGALECGATGERHGSPQRGPEQGLLS